MGMHKVPPLAERLVEKGTLPKSDCSAALLRFLRPVLEAGAVQEQRAGAGRRLVVVRPAALLSYINRKREIAAAAQEARRMKKQKNLRAQLEQKQQEQERRANGDRGEDQNEQIKTLQRELELLEARLRGVEAERDQEAT